jgi:hypothetical protein
MHDPGSLLVWGYTNNPAKVSLPILYSTVLLLTTTVPADARDVVANRNPAVSVAATMLIISPSSRVVVDARGGLGDKIAHARLSGWVIFSEAVRITLEESAGI